MQKGRFSIGRGSGLYDRTAEYCRVTNDLTHLGRQVKPPLIIRPSVLIAPDRPKIRPQRHATPTTLLPSRTRVLNVS